MTDIKEFTLEELEDDKAESLIDIKICELALLHNITTYSGDESVKFRLKTNKKIVLAIDTELQRRQNEQ